MGSCEWDASATSPFYGVCESLTVCYTTKRWPPHLRTEAHAPTLAIRAMVVYMHRLFDSYPVLAMDAVYDTQRAEVTYPCSARTRSGSHRRSPIDSTRKGQQGDINKGSHHAANIGGFCLPGRTCARWTSTPRFRSPPRASSIRDKIGPSM